MRILLAIEQIFISGNFLKNKAKYGGAVFFWNNYVNVTFRNINVTGNSGNGLWITNCNIIFSGYVNLINNSGTLGGAIYSRNSVLSFTEKVTFANNSAESGGAFYMLYYSVITHCLNTNLPVEMVEHSV